MYNNYFVKIGVKIQKRTLWEPICPLGRVWDFIFKNQPSKFEPKNEKSEIWSQFLSKFHVLNQILKDFVYFQDMLKKEKFNDEGF